ncbi:unnamed protein product [Closterium sp. NIES-64]|nr:unnamed protein product [Closterium sp. NIES-65]CAI5991990.1 unnamed protein product [Closterium sp. NIES-64]CAI5992634.1 unnamed protein product [Closterium sp. NIES-65]
MGVRHRVSHRGSHCLAVAPQRIAKITTMGLVDNCLQRVNALLVTNPPVVGEPSAHRKRDPPLSTLCGDLRRGGGGGGGLLDVAGIRDVASSPLRVRTRLVPKADGAGGMAGGDAVLVASRILPSIAPRIRLWKWCSRPGRVGSRLTSISRILNVAEACEVVANLQLAVCAATQNFPSSYGPGSRGSCVTLAESLESPLALVSEAPAGVAPLARTFPRHVGDLAEAARVGTPVSTLQS